MKTLSTFWILLAAPLAVCLADNHLPPLQVSDNHRFLVTVEGRPFFWLADTAWELFHRLDRDEAEHYLKDRAAKGFTVVQAVALAELNGLTETNRNGHLPLLGNDPARPDVKPGPGNDYWDFVDELLDRAAANGLYVGLLPTWGKYVTSSAFEGKVDGLFNASNALAYGRFLGERWRGRSNLIWILGGDKAPSTPEAVAIWRALARGIAVGVCGAEDYSKVLMTYHTSGPGHVSDFIHDETWLDFTSAQSSHGDLVESWRFIEKHWHREPIKPVIDLESSYPGALITAAWLPEAMRAAHRSTQPSNDDHARRAAYWAVFAGAAGHTYGHNSIWQMYAPPRKPVLDAKLTWRDALNAPSARQMGYLRKLIESRSLLTQRPDPSLLAFEPKEPQDRCLALRGDRFALVYTPTGRTLEMQLGKLDGAKVNAWWFNPRDGETTAVGEFVNQGRRQFDPPGEAGPGNDWVLVLDDSAPSYPPLGLAKSTGESVRPGSLPERFKILQVGTRPESITKGFGGHYYVTVMGDQQPGDAVIKVINGDRIEVFAAGLDEPKGIAFVGGFLVTTDVKRVWRIDARGNKTVLAEEKDFPHPVSYLNDTAAAPDGRGVLVTDMGARDKIMGPDGLWPLDSPEAKSLPHIGRIYSIDLEGLVRLTVDAAPEMACPNGVCAPAIDRLLIAEFFHGNLLQARSGKLEILNTGFRGADGIEGAKSGEIYLSSWTQGKVWRLDERGQNPKLVVEGLQSAADFYLDEPARLLLVPDMKAGTIIFVPLK